MTTSLRGSLVKKMIRSKARLSGKLVRRLTQTVPTRRLCRIHFLTSSARLPEIEKLAIPRGGDFLAKVWFLLFAIL